METTMATTMPEQSHKRYHLMNLEDGNDQVEGFEDTAYPTLLDAALAALTELGWGLYDAPAPEEDDDEEDLDDDEPTHGSAHLRYYEGEGFEDG